MKPYKSAVLGSIALVASFATFLWFANAADRAMDKSGIGDLASWETLNNRAGISFWVTVALWALLLSLGLSRRGSERSQLLAICGLSLLAAPAALLAVIVT